MSTVRKRGRLARSLAVTVALVGTSVALLPAPSAQATVTGTVTGGSTAWKVSNKLANGPGNPHAHPAGYVAPATYDATSLLSSWGGGSGTIATDQSATMAFQGTAVYFTNTSGAWIQFGAPQVAVDADGNGTVSAVVSYGLGAGTPGAIPYDPAAVQRASGTPIAIVTLSGNSAADRTTTPATTTWTGLDGTWAPAFTAFLAGDTTPDPDIPPFTYAGSFDQLPAGQEEAEKPQPFTFTLTKATPSVAVSTTATNPTTGVTLKVTGDGFRGVTNASPPPADNGIYVGLAPAGTMPDVSSMAGMSSFAASAYIPAAAMTTGAISTSLTAAPDKLDRTKSYAIYTWQAHTHSNTSQDTQTPVTINWAALKQSSTVAATWKKKPKTVNNKGKITVAVTGAAGTPTGDVTLTLERKGQEKVKTIKGTLVNGSLLVKLPKLKKGKWTVTVDYAGNASYAASTSELKVKVNAKK